MLPNPLFLNVHMYGIMIAVGVLCCFATLFLMTKKLNIDPKFTDFMYYNGIAAIVIGFGSATLFQSFYNYLDNPEGGFILGGMTFIGGLIGGVVSFIAGYAIFRKKYETTLFDTMSFFPCPILIAHAFGRVGCFFAGCCYGKVSYGPFGVKFPLLSEPVLPVMLYEAIFLLVLYGVTVFLLLRYKFNYNMSLYLVAYGIFRFFIEFARGDARGSFIPGISPSQFWSIVMVCIGVGLFFYMYERDKKRGSFLFYTAGAGEQTPVEEVPQVENGTAEEISEEVAAVADETPQDIEATDAEVESQDEEAADGEAESQDEESVDGEAESQDEEAADDEAELQDDAADEESVPRNDEVTK